MTRTEAARGFSKIFSKISVIFVILFCFSNIYNSVSHASLVWQYTTDGPVTIKPVVHQGMIIIASDDGKVYSLEPTTGTRIWQRPIGRPTDLFSYDNGIIVTTKDGKVIKLGNSGNTIWENDLTKQNATYAYGASGGQKYIFVTANNGAYILEKNGNFKSKIASWTQEVATPPLAFSIGDVIYGKGNDLVRLTENGQIVWKTVLNNYLFWTSRPATDGDYVYIGGLDNNLHSYNLMSGEEVWKFQTKGWILSTPQIINGNVYFGSDDGHVYSTDSSGNLRWQGNTQLAVQTQPEFGTIGGKEVIFVGSVDKNIYAISDDDGEILWKSSFNGPVASPRVYQNKIIFGSSDGNVYAYNNERTCSINEPKDGVVIGQKEITVKGKYVTEAGLGKTSIQINEEPWTEANYMGDGWVYYIDPKILRPGLNTISCKVTDSSGDETGPPFTTVIINRDNSMPMGNLIVSLTPTNLVENSKFTVFVNDAENGIALTRFKVNFNGKEYNVDKNTNINLTASVEGAYQLVVKKLGYKDQTITVNVGTSGIPPIYLAIGTLVIIFILARLWSKMNRKS